MVLASYGTRTQLEQVVVTGCTSHEQAFAIQNMLVDEPLDTKLSSWACKKNASNSHSATSSSFFW